MSTTDTILVSLTEQVRQLQAAIDWLDDHRATIDQCSEASVHPHGGPNIYLHAGYRPKEIAKALGTKWTRTEYSGCISWHMEQPKIHVDLALWKAERKPEAQSGEVQL